MCEKLKEIITRDERRKEEGKKGKKQYSIAWFWRSWFKYDELHIHPFAWYSTPLHDSGGSRLGSDPLHEYQIVVTKSENKKEKIKKLPIDIKF